MSKEDKAPTFGSVRSLLRCSIHRAIAAMVIIILIRPAWPAAIAQTETQPHESSKDEARGAGRPSARVLSQCLQLIRAHRTEEARAILAPIVEAHPDWAKATFYLALTYQEESRYEPSRELCRKALELDPNYHTVLMFLGWAQYYLGDLGEARRAFESYEKVNPNYPDVHFGLGLIELDEDHVAEARTRLLKAIDLSAKRKDARGEAKSWARMADVCLRENNVAEARQALEKSLALNPNNYEPYFKLSRVLQRLGDEEGAARARKMHEEMRAKALAAKGRGERRPGE